MSGVRFLPAKSRPVRPWKNGGGVTRDIVVFPAEAGDDDFLWRASIATIASAGPFSAFPGVDRMFLLLKGTLTIGIGDGGEQRMDPRSPALAFDGEERVHARVPGSECTALNIMTRRGRASARVDRWEIARASSADALLIVCPETAMIRCSEEAFDLAAGDALLLDRPADLSEIKGAVIAVELSYAAA
jgi:environmental stress-induced protein Ves